MGVEVPPLEFYLSPTTVSFVVPYSETFMRYIGDKPYIVPNIMLDGGYLLVYSDEQYVGRITSDLGTFFAAAQGGVLGLLDEQAMQAAGILQVQQQPFLNLTGSGTLVGMVDTGIDYTSNVFRYEDGSTKIAGLFDMTIQGNPPFDFPIGSEYSQEQINQALRAPDPYAVVPSVDTSGHGTFLASLAAGRPDGDFIGAAPNAELLVVKLRKARPNLLREFLVPPEQEHAYASTAVMVGVEYIVRKSQELGKPVSICIGLGTNFGGHDNLSIFEQYINRVCTLPGFCVSVAAGNEVGARHHYSGIIDKVNVPRQVQLRVGEDAGDVYLSIWNTAADRMSVSVTSPSGEVIQRFPAADLGRLETRLILEQATVIIEYYFPTRGLGAQATVIKILKATPGIWTINLYGEIILQGDFHMYLPIRGFVSPTVEFLEPDPNHTLLVPGTTLQAVAVGGYNSRTNSLYENSSWGPSRLGILGPDIVAPAMNVIGVYPRTGFGTMTGTSVATAITSGAGALFLQWGVVQGRYPTMGTSQIRAFMIRGATRFPDISYPNNQWGFGALNLYAAFEALR